MFCLLCNQLLSVDGADTMCTNKNCHSKFFMRKIDNDYLFWESYCDNSNYIIKSGMFPSLLPSKYTVLYNGFNKIIETNEYYNLPKSSQDLNDILNKLLKLNMYK